MGQPFVIALQWRELLSFQLRKPRDVFRKTQQFQLKTMLSPQSIFELKSERAFGYFSSSCVSFKYHLHLTFVDLNSNRLCLNSIITNCLKQQKQLKILINNGILKLKFSYYIKFLFLQVKIEILYNTSINKIE